MSNEELRPDTSVDSHAIYIDGARLKRVGARPGLFAYVKRLWEYRQFILFDSKSRVASGNAGDSLGQIWLVLNPILNGATYFFVFGILLGTGRGIENFIGYLIIGVFMFRFTSGSVVSGARSVSGNRTVVRAFSFPRATLPISVVVRELLTHIPTFITMFVLLLIIPPHAPLTWKWLLFIPVLILQAVMNLGVGLLLARLVSRWNDVSNLIPFLMRMWLYLSCVFYGVERFADNSVLLTLMHLNPMFCVLDITRNALLYDTFADPERWLVLGIWTFLALIVGFIMFWKAEESYGHDQ